MSFMDDLKTDQRTQILVAGMIFFAIAFPAYFGYAASNVDDYDLTGPIGTFRGWKFRITRLVQIVSC